MAVVVLGPLEATRRALRAADALIGWFRLSAISEAQNAARRVTRVRSLLRMDELHRIADKLFTEVDHLDRLLDGYEMPGGDELALALIVAKRVRTNSTLLVRRLAALRDQATA